MRKFISLLLLLTTTIALAGPPVNWFGSAGKFYDSVTQVEGPSGSTAAPGWTFSSDPASGMYLPSASTLAFATAGTNRYSISSTGTHSFSGPMSQTETGTSYTDGFQQCSTNNNCWLIYSDTSGFLYGRKSVGTGSTFNWLVADNAGFVSHTGTGISPNFRLQLGGINTSTTETSIVGGGATNGEGQLAVTNTNSTANNFEGVVFTGSQTNTPSAAIEVTNEVNGASPKGHLDILTNDTGSFTAKLRVASDGFLKLLTYLTKGVLAVDSGGSVLQISGAVNGSVLTADSTQPLGAVWAAASGSSNQFGTYTAAKTSNYTCAANDNVPANTASGSFTVTLFSASGNTDKVCCVVLIGDNAVTISSTDLLNGASTYTLSDKYSSVCFKSTGSTFYAF